MDENGEWVKWEELGNLVKRERMIVSMLDY